MEMVEVKVYASGFLFSDLITRSSNCSYDTEGLLFGHESVSSVSNITDTQSAGEKKERKIVVQSCVHSSDLYSFYDTKGEIKSNAIRSKNKTLLGWYKVRRNTKAAISLKENTIIRRMLKDPSFTNKRDVLFLLLMPFGNDTGATLSFPYKCFICRIDSAPRSTKINICNLGEQAATAEYKDRSLLLSNNPDNQLSKVQEHCQSAFLDERGCIHQVKAVYNVFQSAMANLKEMQQEVAHTQATMHHLEDDIQRFEAMADDVCLDAEDGVDDEEAPHVNESYPKRDGIRNNPFMRENQLAPKSNPSPRHLYSKTTNL